VTSAQIEELQRDQHKAEKKGAALRKQFEKVKKERDFYDSLNQSLLSDRKKGAAELRLVEEEHAVKRRRRRADHEARKERLEAKLADTMLQLEASTTT